MQNTYPSRGALVIAGFALLTLGVILIYKSANSVTVTSFDECAAAGYPIMESFPAQCSDGTQTFVQNIVETEISSESGNVRVTSPTRDGLISLPLTITGQGRAFENTIDWRLLDEDGTVLVSGFATADAQEVGGFGAFEVTSSYPEPKGTRGTVEVFTTSARDGSEQDVVSIPVTFASQGAQSVRAYFSSTAEDPETLNCEITYPVTRRIAQTTAPARATLEELFRGPTNAERQAGFTTSIPSGVKIGSLTIDDRGVAKLDLSGELRAASGGSCRVGAVRSQIESTLKQFPTVTSVVITVNGQVDVLEP